MCTLAVCRRTAPLAPTSSEVLGRLNELACVFWLGEDEELVY